jgi:hypothetical protein
LKNNPDIRFCSQNCGLSYLNNQIDNQKHLIKKYFNLLVQEFIKDPKHKDIKIIFEDFSKPETQAQTTRYKNGRINSKGKTISEEYSYTIQFLANGYKNKEDLRSTVVHEFTHLWLFSTVGNHKHGNEFYS